MRKIGVQTGSILDNVGIDEGFRLIHEAGFDCVDFNIDHCMSGKEIVSGEFSGFFDQDMEKILEAIRPYKEAAAKYGVTFGQAHAPFPTYVKDKPYNNEKVLDALKKCLAICAYVDCPYMIVHPAFFDYNNRMDPDDEWDANIKLYSALIPDIRKYHVTVCLENMFTYNANGRKVYEAICSDMNEAAAYIDELNDMAGEKCFAFCLDTGHALLLGKDIYTAIMQIGERLETLHIHDNDGKGDQHLAPYMGCLDWKRFVKGLRDVGYQGALSFETFNTINVFDLELMPEVLRLIGATGRMFARRIDAE